MINYPYKMPRPVYLNDNRGFFVPFLLGGLAGSAVVGFSRPRPIVNAAPVNSGFNPYYPSANYSYSYYMPKYPY